MANRPLTHTHRTFSSFALSVSVCVFWRICFAYIFKAANEKTRESRAHIAERRTNQGIFVLNNTKQLFVRAKRAALAESFYSFLRFAAFAYLFFCCHLSYLLFFAQKQQNRKKTAEISHSLPANVVIQSKEKLRINEHTSRQNKRQQSNKSKASTTKQNHKKNCAVICFSLRSR